MDKKINTEEDAFRNASSTNICFDCQLAIGGCEWSAKFEPVPGWTAEEVDKQCVYGSGECCNEDKYPA